MMAASYNFASFHSNKDVSDDVCWMNPENFLFNSDESDLFLDCTGDTLASNI